MFEGGIKSVFAMLGVAISYFFGGWDVVLQALVVLVVLDYITGVIAAGCEGKLNASVGFKGIAKKFMIFALLAVAAYIDRTGIIAEPVFRTVVAWFYIANEGISIIDNAARIGVPVPQKLRDALESVKDDKYKIGGSQ